MIINQIVAGSGGGAQDGILYTTTGGVLTPQGLSRTDFSDITEVSTYCFYQLGSFLRLSAPVSGVLDFRNTTTIGDYAFSYSFNQTNITYIDFRSVETINANYGFERAFDGAKLTGFDFSNLKTIGTGNDVFKDTFKDNTTLVGAFSFPKLENIKGFGTAFQGDTGITFFGFPKVKVIGIVSGSDQAGSVFLNCSGLTGTNLNALETIYGTNTMNAMYKNTGLLKVAFPMLTTVPNNPFSVNCFETTTLTEIHFRKDMQATIEAVMGYSTQWGASNATVYFDLVGTLTGADGNTYTRDEYNSVYSDQHGQFQTAVAWKYNDTTYYTPFSANEPAVSDTIYSDAACTVAVTTISAIA